MPTIDFQVLNNNDATPTIETLSGSGIGFLALVPDLQFKLVNIKPERIFRMLTDLLSRTRLPTLNMSQAFSLVADVMLTTPAQRMTLVLVVFLVFNLAWVLDSAILLPLRCKTAS